MASFQGSPGLFQRTMAHSLSHRRKNCPWPFWANPAGHPRRISSVSASAGTDGSTGAASAACEVHTGPAQTQAASTWPWTSLKRISFHLKGVLPRCPLVFHLPRSHRFKSHRAPPTFQVVNGEFILRLRMSLGKALAWVTEIHQSQHQTPLVNSINQTPPLFPTLGCVLLVEATTCSLILSGFAILVRRELLEA